MGGVIKFSILIESCKSSSSKYKNDLVEKAKLAEQEAKAKKMNLEAKEKQAKKKKKIECIEAHMRHIYSFSMTYIIFLNFPARAEKTTSIWKVQQILFQCIP